MTKNWIYRANQWTPFYMIGTFVMKELCSLNGFFQRCYQIIYCQKKYMAKCHLRYLQCLSVLKMKFLSTPKEYLKRRKKKQNAKYVCFFYKKSRGFDFIWSHSFMTRNVEDMESQCPELLWSNYNHLILRVKMSSHVCNKCDNFF